MSCPRFIAESLALRNAAHVLHLTTKSEPRHRAIGAFYEALVGLTDRYAEVYMGLEGKIVSIPAAAPPRGEAEELLRDYLDLVREEMDEDHGSEALKNILAETEELIGQTLYRLLLK